MLSRRPDGYHDIASLVVFVDLFDTLAIRPGASAPSCTVQGDAPAGPDNLAARAATALNQTVAIRIHKRIPIGAGLGGGSSDAAAVLRALGASNRADIARTLGADVPVCLRARPAWLTGIGDIVQPIDDLPDFALLLVWPTGVSLATATMYHQLARTTKSLPAPPKPVIGHSLPRLVALVSNDFERLVYVAVPKAILARDTLMQLGAHATTVTGKGPTIFGLFKDFPQAFRAQETLRARLGSAFQALAVRCLSA